MAVTTHNAVDERGYAVLEPFTMHNNKVSRAVPLSSVRNVPSDNADNSTAAEFADTGNKAPERSDIQPRRRRIRHMCLIVACVLLVIPLYWAMSAIAPAKSGLDCDRLSFYRHPHKKPFMSTLLFTIMCYVTPLVILSLAELFMEYEFADVPPRMMYSLCPSWHAPPWLYLVLKNFVVYVFGVQASQGAVYLVRKMVAIPRPDFWEVCQPVFHTADGACPPHQFTYDYSCRNPDESKWQNASRSFPSGHVAYAFFTAAFCMLYLERRCVVPKCQHLSVRYVLMTVEFWLFAACFATSAERVHYNSHHPSDIYVGALFGIVGAVFVARLLTLPPNVVHASKNISGWPRSAA